MLKVTNTRSGMTIVTIKFAGIYANITVGKTAKRKPTLAELYARASRDRRNAAERLAEMDAREHVPSLAFKDYPAYAKAKEQAMYHYLSAR